MKRCILVDSRTNKDEKTKDDLLFLILVKLPCKMSNGGLWHHKANELVVNVCINKTNKPQDYEALEKVLPGALFDIEYGYNDFNGKSFVSSCKLVDGSNMFTYDEVYV